MIKVFIEEIFEVVLEKHNMVTFKTSDGNILLEPVIMSDKKKLPMLVESLNYMCTKP